MSIIGTRTLFVILSHSEWDAVATAIKRESRRNNARWILLDVSGYGRESVYLSLSINGPYFRDLDDIFAAHVADWECMAEV